MRLTRIGRGLSSLLNMPKPVQSQIDWSDKSEENEFRILEVLNMFFAMCRGGLFIVRILGHRR